MAAFVGIDLGTTFSVVAYINKDGQPQAIASDSGRYITPSVVYFGPDGPIVGSEAKEKQAAGDQAVASFFKRHMGDTQYELMFDGKTYSPVDLSALVLKHLKQVAEERMREPVTHAVITVPAYFNNLQREATIEAGKAAGLDVLSIISEPTAAALAYGLRPAQGSQTVLVYDLGGGTFDVSVVQISPSEQRVLGTGGDHFLGGKDWDDRIFNYLSSHFEQEFGLELVGDDYNALIVKAEDVKKSLSSRQSIDVRVGAGGKVGNYTISRNQFEEITTDLMGRTQRLTEQVLDEIRINWSKLDHVLLVGGSTRMPMVKQWVENMSGKPPLNTVNPDEAVALGAAIQAAWDMEALNPQAPTMFLGSHKKSIDVISHSLGMIAKNNDATRYINSILILKNQPIPCNQTRPYALQVGRRTEDKKLEVFLTQGETENPVDCAYLGKYVFSEIPPLVDKTAVLDITYSYDRNGVVKIAAIERSSGKHLKLSIEPLPEDIPYRFTQPPVNESIREPLTVYLAFDLSGSMSGEPLKEAQKAAHAFLAQCDLSNTAIGLISFSDSVYVDAPASQNAKQISKAIDELHIGRTGYGNAGHPFDEIYGRLRNVQGIRYALVLADGVWSDQHIAIASAKKCHQEEIQIIGIGFGGADKAFLKAISSSDENSFFTNARALSETFSSIAQELTEGGTVNKGGRLRLFK